MRLVLLEVCPSNLQQLIQRQIHHLVKLQLLGEGIRTNAEVTIRLRQQFRLQPSEVIIQLRNQRRICLSKFSIECRVRDIRKGQRHVVFKEAYNAGQLLDGNLGVNARRIFEVHPRIGQECRHPLLPCNKRAQAIRSEEHTSELQ